MVSHRILLSLAACLAWSTLALAQHAPVWQPFRVVAPPAYVTDLQGVSEEVVSDIELDEMCVDCGDPVRGYYVPQYATSPAYANAPYGDPVLAPLSDGQAWDWHLLPEDLIWHSYWAGMKEPRISGTWFQETQDNVSLLGVTLGGRSSVLRYGTVDQGRPEGWELQLEGAAMSRLNLDFNWDLEAVDFRFGVPLIFGIDRSQWKFSYYHLSSHLGDEKAIREGNLASRINYSRDVLVVAYSFFPVPALRLYSEAGWALYADEGSDPWEFQFGVDYAQPGPTGRCGTPFFAVNGHLRQEVDFGGNFVAQAGWLWRGNSGKVLRTGVHYFNGKSSQFEFYDEFEQQIGIGLWHEF